MRNVFLISILFAVFAFSACSGPAADHVNANFNLDANGNPIPVVAEITDASTALAEGNRLFDIGETEAAIAAYQKAVELDPATAEAYFKMGIAFALIERRDSQNIEETPTPLPGEEKPEKVKPNSEKAFEKAIDAYKKLIEADPKNDVAHFNLGRAHAKLNDDQEAARALRQATRLQPDYTEYQTELGVMLIRLAKYDEAVGTLKKAVELDPTNSQAEELLERAEAGRKRINFTTLPRDPRKDANTEASDEDAKANTAVPAEKEKVPAPPPPAKPAGTPPPPKKP